MNMHAKLSKFRLIYYKALVDRCFDRFFGDYDHQFQKDGSFYVFTENWTQHRIQKVFSQYLSLELQHLAVPYSFQAPDYYIVIGSCTPKDNILLSGKMLQLYFPKKLDKIISGDAQLKYFLKERDIKLDIQLFNSAIESLFVKLFSSKDYVCKLLGKNYGNVIFVKNSKLDCYTLFKTIKHLYGKSNCQNVHKEKLYDMKNLIIATNDLIDRYVVDKTFLNSSAEYQKCMSEVKQFIDESIKERAYGR